MVLPGRFVLQPVALALVALLVIHELGRARLLAAGGEGRPPAESRRQAWLFRAGIAVAALGLLSPLEHEATFDLLSRALVDYLLCWVAAPLLVLGAPWRPLRAGIAFLGHGGSTRRPRRAGAGDGRPTRVSPPSRPSLGGPLLGTGAVLVVFWGWHVPAALDATTHSLGIRCLEVLCVLVAGIVLWAQIVSSHPFEPRWPPLYRIVLIVATLGGTWLLSAAMVYSSTLWYPAFDAGPGRLVGALASQQFAGAIAWGLPAIPLGVATFWCLATWLHQEDADEAELRQLLEHAGAAAVGPRGEDEP